MFASHVASPRTRRPHQPNVSGLSAHGPPPCRLMRWNCTLLRDTPEKGIPAILPPSQDHTVAEPMGRSLVHPGERAIHSELVSILDIAPKVYDVMGVRKEVGGATAPWRQPRSGFPLQRSG
jgi:hypothetical protein